MSTTEKPTTLVAAVAAAMAESAEVTKKGENKEQGYKFASAESILAAVRKPLLERGVILTAEIASLAEQEVTSRNGGKGSLITIEVEFTFRGLGEQLTIKGWRGQGQDYGDKALGKAYTNAIKTFIRTQWLLPTEHDDPEASSPGERIAPQLPAWAAEAEPERKREWLTILEPIIGADRATALGGQLASKWGHMPDGAVAIAKAIIAEVSAELGDDFMLVASVAADKRADLAAQAAAGEIADGPSPAEQPDAEPTLDDVLQAEAAAQAQADAEAATPAPASIPAPNLPKDPAKRFGTLKAAGCTCPDPIGVRSERPELDEACPIIGHGIPL